MKKTFLILIFFVTTLILVACGGYTPDNNWVLEKDRLNEDPEIENFVTSLQDNPDKRGFKVFTISEGRKMVVISTGDVERSLELDNVKVDSGNTKVILKEMENKNDEANPYIMVGISAIKGELFVQDADLNSYDEF
ncbi:MAG TPA: hypothetical protein K8V56_01040 [Sporosarcina psychrophila]|uniref:Uncharacterized protein n=1 Tax=Sporosarcina psychrophila TaxID=1476 RepID=A0A921FYB3_SPOPS|nr:hypothetical protein [Sporosarcina psychrophila]